MNASLYIHVPYCLKKCDYCDFFSVPIARDEGFSGYIAKIGREITQRKKQLNIDKWATVYIGGGTPSLLQPADIRALCSGIAGDMVSTGKEPPEWTIEANPEDLTAEWLRACETAGINRLSLGIQSLRDPILASIGRRGSRSANLAALDLAASIWKGRLSVDFIAGLPGLSDEDLIEDLRQALAFGPDHVSLYSLTVEENTPLYAHICAKKIQIPEDDAAAEQWIAGRDFLASRGFLQYEVSNFALEGFESRHNLAYWNLQTYVGVGPGATGTIQQDMESFRYTNTNNIDAWIKDPLAGSCDEPISRADTLLEYILMGFRLSRGIDKKRFTERFSLDLNAVIGRTAKKWQDKGLLKNGDDRMSLTQAGLLVLNRFLLDCMEEMCED